ncbi:MAG: TOBE domain-containing protein, partial [Leptolyngbyaceae cyanobacterium SL_7_1]|nr:TOBE domain-containing protein [Leptolyngbyaceae cyanobacterium SL_7_1]
PSEIYEYPTTPFVADFIGDTNLFQGRVESSDASTWQVRTDRGLRICVASQTMGNGTLPQNVVISVRPEKIDVSLEKPAYSLNCFEGRVMHTMYLGTHMHYIVELLSGDRLTVLQPSRLESPPDAHTPIHVSWAASDGRALAA